MWVRGKLGREGKEERLIPLSSWLAERYMKKYSLIELKQSMDVKITHAILENEIIFFVFYPVKITRSQWSLKHAVTFSATLF